MTACLLCGGRANRDFTAFARSWRRCVDCHSASLVGDPAGAGATEGRGPTGMPEARDWKQPEERALLKSRAAMVRRLAPGRRVLDVGAALGTFVEEARGLGLEVHGVEADPEARRLAAERGISMFSADLDSLAPDWHAATLWSSLGHEADPAAVIRTVRRLLVPGGIIAITAPNASGLSACLWRDRCEWLDHRRHRYRHLISRRGLEALFDRAGLSLLGLSTRGMLDLRRIPTELYPGRPAGKRVDSALLQVSGALRPIVETFRLGETIIAYARR